MNTDNDFENEQLGSFEKTGTENEPVNLNYARNHLRTFLKNRPAIRLSSLEEECSISKGVLKHFLEHQVNIVPKCFESLKEGLFKYGYTALNSE